MALTSLPSYRLLRGFVEEDFSDLGSLAERIVELAPDQGFALRQAVGTKIWERTGEGTVAGVSVRTTSGEDVGFAIFTPDARLGSFGHVETLTNAIRRRDPTLAVQPRRAA
jgi:hypothetical protein